MHIDLGRLHREGFAFGIEEVDESGVLEVLDIVHRGCPTETDGFGYVADVKRTRCVLHQDIKQFAQFMETSHIDLLDHEHIHFKLGVHHLEQFGLKGLGLQIGRIVTVIEVVPEIIERSNAFAYLTRDRGMALDDLFERIRAQLKSRLDIKVLAEGETTQVIGLHDAFDIVVILIDRHDGCSTEDNMEVAVLGIAAFEFPTPVGVLEQLVQEEVLTACLRKRTGQFEQGMLGEAEVVEADIETRAYILEGLTRFASSLVFGFGHVPPLRLNLFDTGKEEVGFSHTSSAFDSDQTIFPINLVHQLPANGHKSVCYEEIMDPKKGI